MWPVEKKRGSRRQKKKLASEATPPNSMCSTREIRKREGNTTAWGRDLKKRGGKKRDDANEGRVGTKKKKMKLEHRRRREENALRCMKGRRKEAAGKKKRLSIPVLRSVAPQAALRGLFSKKDLKEKNYDWEAFKKESEARE